jgi:serine/threonine-protein kinase
MKRGVIQFLVLAGATLSACSIRGQGPVELATQARDVLKKYCFECHGQNLKRLRGDLNLFDRSHLLDKERGIVVPGKPDASSLWQQVQDGSMPPGQRSKVNDVGKRLLRDWISAGAPVFAEEKATTSDTDVAAERAARVKEVFRVHCLECHGGARKQAGVAILDHGLLLKKKKVVPGKADESLLFQLVIATDDTVMPPPGQPRLRQDEIDLVRLWISDGAPAFPSDVRIPVKEKTEPAPGSVGVEYVLKKILRHIREVPPQERRFKRYFSINHTLMAGATADELELQREALAKAINHLSWEPRLVRPIAVDEPVKSVFVIDLRDLGWQMQPFERVQGSRKTGRSPVNLFDLALLDYPYGILQEGADTFDDLVNEFLAPSDMVRPIPYVRADWFVGVVTQPPFYEDFLQLPFDLKELEEKKLGIDTAANVRDGVARRAGLAVSGVSRNNRVVERHPFQHGAYWKSFDFRTTKGAENIFRDPILLHPAGGEMIFNLPNGLQGYYVANNQGVRVESAPTEIVTDKYSDDKVVRLGLSCIRCHERGMKEFADTIRPALLRLPGSPGFDKRFALRLYAEQPQMDDWLKEDSERFASAMAKLVGRSLTREPLIPVTRRYLDDPLHLGTVAGELGLADTAGLQEMFRAPQFVAMGLMPLGSQGVIRREAFEEFFEPLVRGLGLGVPVVPLDGVALRDFAPASKSIPVALTTNKKLNVFEPGDELVVTVTNSSERAIWIELIGTSARGRKVILTPTPLQVGPGQSYRFPPQGGLKIRGGLGKEQITLFASHQEFPGGELLRGAQVSDRVVHPYYQYRKDGNRWRQTMDPTTIVKKTIDIETK